jgi:N-methylhydantoinase A/oxoprolinase/acetone carboxylase beta subunit
MKIGIGIDTGGTYTDAVAYALDSHTILGTAKSLTTKEDLTLGILGAVDQLPGGILKQAEIVSLSTTLITNACVENKTGRAKLIFFGGDERVIEKYGAEYGLPPISEMLLQECKTKFNGEIENEPDWEIFLSRMNQGEFEYLDGVGIIEMYAMKNGAVVEKKAKEIFEKNYDVPVVCGHELFSELSCLQRGSSTLLNASLFPTIQSFLSAIKNAMAQRGIQAAVVIVRSDGSLMDEEFAAVRPIETLLCGPAASVLGGYALSKESNCIVVDMGGTTTDIAIIKDGNPVTVLDGVKIGKWKTFVDGLYIKTFGLGGDSAIHYKDQKLVLESYRIVPMCIAAKQYPSILTNLRALLQTNVNHTRFLYEHFILVKDITNNGRYSDEERAFCHALENEPLMLKDAAAAVGRDIYNLDVSRLVQDGVVQKCGLTPTDIMHMKGDFSAYSQEASALAAQFVAQNLNVSLEELCDQVYDEIKRKIYFNIVAAMLENRFPHYFKSGISREVELFINESYDMAKKGSGEHFLSMNFSTDFSLLGIGAPIHIFLDDVAQMLGTKAIIPEHSEVANALGAVVGNVVATHSIEIRPNYSAEESDEFVVFGNSENKTFEELEEAETFAVKEAEAGAKAEALNRGAQGHITVTSTITKNEAAAKDCIVYLGTTVTACAIGTIGF